MIRTSSLSSSPRLRLLRAGCRRCQQSQLELETVKGIGPGLSGKILDARKAGAFRTGTTWSSASAAARAGQCRQVLARPG